MRGLFAGRFLVDWWLEVACPLFVFSPLDPLLAYFLGFSGSAAMWKGVLTLSIFFTTGLAFALALPPSSVFRPSFDP